MNYQEPWVAPILTLREPLTLPIFREHWLLPTTPLYLSLSPESWERGAQTVNLERWGRKVSQVRRGFKARSGRWVRSGLSVHKVNKDPRGSKVYKESKAHRVR